jgi:hypothetical protein
MASAVTRLWRAWRAEPLRWTLFSISVGTFASGILLIAAQRWMLHLFSAPTTTSDRLFFGIIGMFMAIVGGTLTQELLRARPAALVVGWSALQKLCASGAMALAVALSVFSYYGIILSGFDFSSALIAIGYWWHLQR